MRLIVVILFIFSLNLAHSSSVYNIRVNNAKFSVKALNHYNNDLISINQISKHILPNSKVFKKENTIEAQDYKITFTPGAIYIVKENWLGKRVAQLDLPVMQMKNNIYFPLKSFLYSLDTLDIYNVLEGDDSKHYLLANNDFSGLGNFTKLQSLDDLLDESKKSIRNEDPIQLIFTNKDGKKMGVRTNNPYRKSFESISNKLYKSLDLLKPEEFKASPKIEELPIITPPNDTSTQYNLPEGLIRRELEEVKINPKK